MAWESYKPENRVRAKQPSVKIHVVGRNSTLLINSLLVKELGLNNLTKGVLLRYDKERNVMGLTFHHTLSNDKAIRVGRRIALDRTTIRTVNITQFLYDILPERLSPGTYNLTYHREGKIFVMSLNNLVKSEFEEE